MRNILRAVLLAVMSLPVCAAEPGGTAAQRGAPKPVRIEIDAARPWAPAEQKLTAVNSARELPLEDVAAPVRSSLMFADSNILWVPNPDGKSWDVIPIYFKRYGGPNTLVMMDLGSGETRVENYPAELNWHIPARALAPNGKLYVSVLKGMHVEVCVYDPTRNEMKLKAVSVPDSIQGETHPLVLGTDGKIYAGGAHPSKAATAIQIDPETHAVTDYGALGPSHAPSDCWCYSMGADETHVYVASGKVPWYLVVCEKGSRKSEVLAKTGTVDGNISISQGPDGCTASVSDGDKRADYWLHRGKAIPKSQSCPWQAGSGKAPPAAPPKPAVYTEALTPGSDGKCALWVKAAVSKAETSAEFPGWSCLRYEVPTYPMGITRLVELPDGRLFGTGDSYGGHFLFEPATGKCEYLGKNGLSHYSTAISGNKVYTSGYPSSPLFEYDFTKAWTAVLGGTGPGDTREPFQSPQSNPRLLCRMTEAGTHKMYATAVGASGRIYFGGAWIRNGNCGGVAWWDPQEGKHHGFWKELSNYQVNFMCAAGEGKYIVISTHRVDDPVLGKPKPKQGKLFILEDATGRITRVVEPVAEAKGPGPVAWAGGPRVIGWAPNPADEKRSILYGVDCEKGEVVWKQELPFALPVRIGGNQMEGWDYRLGPDGKLWTYMGAQGDVLVRIDPATVAIEPVGRLPKGGRLAFAPPDIYLSGSENLRRVRGIVQAPR